MKNKKSLSLYDVDARAELRVVPFSAVWFPPRVGEQIELRADIEHGGGVYLVVGIRHVLEDSGPPSQQTASVVSVIVDVKPQHTAMVQEEMESVDLALEEIISVPITPIPAEIPLTPEFKK